MKSAVAALLSVLTLSLAATLLMTWPLPAHITSSLAGTGGDPWQSMWRFTVTAQNLQKAAASHNLSQFLLQELFGNGETQLVNLSVWPYLGLHLLWGEPLAYNLVWLLSFVLSGLAMYIFIRILFEQGWHGKEPFGSRAWWTDQAPALLAALAYMFLPFHVAHAQGHFGAMQIQWLPFILATGLSWWRRPAWGKAILLALLLIVQAWTEHHYLFWLALFALITWVCYPTAVAKLWRSRPHRLQLIAIAIALLVIAISYIPTLRLAAQTDSPLNLGGQQRIRFSMDAFAPFIPAPFHPLWGTVAADTFTKSFTGNVAEATHFLSFTILLSLLFFHQQVPKASKRFWLIVAAIFYLISLGPHLHVFGYVTSIPLPYAVLQHLPLFNSIRTVARASIFVSIAAITLFAWVLRTQVKRPGAAVVLAVFIIVEFLFLPPDSQIVALSPVYDQLKDIPGRAIVELPAATNYTEASKALYASASHGKQVIGDIALERAQTSEDFAVARSFPGLRQLLYLRTTDLREARSEFFNQDLAEVLPDVLQTLDVGAIIVHKDSLSVLQLATVRNFLEKSIGYAPQEFPDDVLYRVTVPQFVKSDHIFLVRGDGWTQVERDVKHQIVFATVAGSSTVAIYNNNQASVPLALSFRYELPLTAPLAVSANSQTVEGVKDKDMYFFSFTAPPGVSSVVFTAPGEQHVRIRDPKLVINEPILLSAP